VILPPVWFFGEIDTRMVGHGYHEEAGHEVQEDRGYVTDHGILTDEGNQEEGRQEGDEEGSRAQGAEDV